jgi:hypothetical protein
MATLAEITRPRIAEMAREADPTTNLFETPLRYSNPRSVYAGKPADVGEPDALGSVPIKAPLEVYLKDDWVQDPSNAGVMAHEGTHSKMISAGRRKAPESIKPTLLEMLRKDPEFLQKYTGFKVPYDRMSYEDQQYILNDDEILARLGSMEAMQSKGTTLEKSRYGKQLFKSPGSMDEYLIAAVPEGYIRKDKPFTETPNLTTSRPIGSSRDALWRAIKKYLD